LDSSFSIAGWVDPSDIWAFKTIALVAAQRQIISSCRATVLLGNDMVDLKRQPSKFSWKSTVLALSASTIPNEFYQ